MHLGVYNVMRSQGEVIDMDIYKILVELEGQEKNQVRMQVRAS